MNRLPKLRSDARRNRELVFLAAKDAFAHQGADTSMDDIARSAGVGVGTLYRAFGSRAGLVEALYADEIERLEVTAASLAADLAPWMALKSWLQAYAVALASKRTMLIELMPLFQRDPDGLAASRRRAAAALDKLLQSAQVAGEVRADLRGADLMLLVNAALSAGDASRQHNLLMDIVLDGVRLGRVKDG